MTNKGTIRDRFQLQAPFKGLNFDAIIEINDFTQVFLFIFFGFNQENIVMQVVLKYFVESCPLSLLVLGTLKVSHGQSIK